MTNFNRRIWLGLGLLLVMLISAGCSPRNSGASKAIEAYIQALGSQDSSKVSSLSCAGWEENAVVESDAFVGVGMQLDSLACEVTGSAGDDAFVTCKGSLSLDYNGEVSQIDLSKRTFLARKEGGDWLMCGYH